MATWSSVGPNDLMQCACDALGCNELTWEQGWYRAMRFFYKKCSV